MNNCYRTHCRGYKSIEDINREIVETVKRSQVMAQHLLSKRPKTITQVLADRHTKLDSERGWMAVSEREWNAYYRSFGAKWDYTRSPRDKITLAFRGCQLRVL